MIKLIEPRKASTQRANLTYRGGPLIPNVEVFCLFATGHPFKPQLLKFFTDILASPMMDQLAEYSVPGHMIGHGKLLGELDLSTELSVSRLSDVRIRRSVITHSPPVNPNLLTFVFPGPHTRVYDSGSASCRDFCGYHDALLDGANHRYYAVIPYASCQGCLGGAIVINAMTVTSSHELCEAITDPVPGEGWYDDLYGEIGDICAWTSKTVAGHQVQLEWSNKVGKCI